MNKKELTFPRIEPLEFSGMGTDLKVLIVVKNIDEARQAKADLAAAKKEYAHLEKIFNRFDPASELTRLNRSLNELVSASDDLLIVAKKSLGYFKQTKGLFDPRIINHLEAAGYARDFKKNDFAPVVQENTENTLEELASDLEIIKEKIRFSRRMDFSGIVKGYATDKIAGMLKEKGWRNFLVDSGGDIFAAGRPPESEKWNIAIEGIDEEKIKLAISDKAVATSGISRRKWERKGKRFHHLIHPKQPTEFSFNLRTVSVIADSAEEADVLAKVLFIQGEDERKKFAENQNIPAIFLYYSARIWISSSAKSISIIGNTPKSTKQENLGRD